MTSRLHFALVFVLTSLAFTQDHQAAFSDTSTAGSPLALSGMVSSIGYTVIGKNVGSKELIAYVVEVHAVILDHEGGKGVLWRRNKVAVFNRDGDSIFSGSTRELGSAVSDACAAIRKDAGLIAVPSR